LQTIRTLDYGILGIATSNEYLDDIVIDVIEDTEGNIYEVRLTLNKKLVAYKVKKN